MVRVLVDCVQEVGKWCVGGTRCNQSTRGAVQQVGRSNSKAENMEKIISFEWAKEVEVALSAGEKKLTELKNELPVIQQKIDESQVRSCCHS